MCVEDAVSGLASAFLLLFFPLFLSFFLDGAGPGSRAAGMCSDILGDTPMRWLCKSM